MIICLHKKLDYNIIIEDLCKFFCAKIYFMLDFFGAYSGIDLLIVLLAYTLAVLCAIIPHELAHGFMAERCGDDTPRLSGRLSFNPKKHLDLIGTICLLLFRFGWAKPVPVNINNFKERKKGLFLVSIAGVITNLTIAFFAIALYRITYFIPAQVYTIVGLNYLIWFIKYFLIYVAIINISLMIFNLIPIFPLDGFNLVASLSKNSAKFVAHMQKNAIIYTIILIFACNIFISPIVNLFFDKFLYFWFAVL